ncbi:leucine-rich repeat protein [Tanacetum coccineum]
MKSPQAIIHLSSSSRVSFFFYVLAIICLTSATVSASYGGNETDYLALLSFKSKITHDPYKVLTSWNHSFHFCDWSGISCGKRHKRVTALRLESKGLEGSLSPHVGNLSFLHNFSLSNNSFQGAIPHELGRLSRLRYLNLNINEFNGVIPTNLSGCSNLEELRLGENKLVGSIPKEMSLLSKLVSLVIEVNKLTGGIPSFLGNITSIEVFSCAENPLGGSIPDTLGLWKSLTIFYSGGCNLYGSIPRSIFNLSLLANFSVAVNHLTGSLPSEIGNQLPNLENLQLRDNELTGVLSPSISNCSKLRYLEMANNNFGGKLTIDFSKLRDIDTIRLQYNNFHGHGEAVAMRFIDSLKNCTRLVELELQNCNLTGVLPVSIGNLSDQLSSLGLGDNQLFGSLPSSIGSLVGLTRLILNSNRFKANIPTTIGKLQKLQHLSLHSNEYSGRIHAAIGNLSFLNVVYLYSNKLEGPWAGNYPSTLGNCKNLNGLLLRYNRLSGKIPKQLLQLPSLTYFLDLSHNSLSGSIPLDIKDLKMLSYLGLSYNNLSGTITSTLGECISLTELYLSGNIFEGIIPSSLSSLRGLGGKVPVVGVFANASLFSVLGNNGLCGGVVTLELPNARKKKKRKSHPSQSLGIENERALVYEFMPNGSVHNWLHSNTISSKLNILQRINILRDVTAALDYLHIRCQTTIVHCDLKPSNILLDDDMVAHVGDFGLARLLGTDSNQNSLTGVKGTIGYAPPEQTWETPKKEDAKEEIEKIGNRSETAKANNKGLMASKPSVSIKYPESIHLETKCMLKGTDQENFAANKVMSNEVFYSPMDWVEVRINNGDEEYGMGSEMTSSGDVYSFGILLLELMTGKKPTDNMFNEGLSIHKFASMALPDHVVDVIDVDASVLQSKEANAKKVEECLAATIKIGVSCSVDSPPQRMKIDIVVNELQRILDVLQNI